MLLKTIDHLSLPLLCKHNSSNSSCSSKSSVCVSVFSPFLS